MDGISVIKGEYNGEYDVKERPYWDDEEDYVLDDEEDETDIYLYWQES